MDANENEANCAGWQNEAICGDGKTKPIFGFVSGMAAGSGKDAPRII